MKTKRIGAAIAIALSSVTIGLTPNVAQARSGYQWDNVNPVNNCDGVTKKTAYMKSGRRTSGRVELRWNSYCGTAWGRFQTYLDCRPGDYGCAYGSVKREKRASKYSPWRADTQLGTLSGTTEKYGWGWTPMLFDKSGNGTLQVRACAANEGPEICTRPF